MKVEKETFQKIADYHGMVLTDKADKVIRAKQFLGVGIKCPCEPENKLRYCGSNMCMKEAKETGYCHCELFHYDKKGL